MGIQADPALYIPQFNNAVFEEGNALKVSGVSIQLVPVGEQIIGLFDSPISGKIQ